MHDIWNPWHGCIKCSEGCAHCYMYFLDLVRDKNGTDIYKTKNGFNYPMQKNKSCMNFEGKAINCILTDELGYDIPKENLYIPHYRDNCHKCGSKPLCNGCNNCKKCE